MQSCRRTYIEPASGTCQQAYTTTGQLQHPWFSCPQGLPKAMQGQRGSGEPLRAVTKLAASKAPTVYCYKPLVSQRKWQLAAMGP